MYAYCLNNPVNMYDDEGTIPKWLRGVGNFFVGLGEVAAGLFVAGTVGWTGFGGAAAGALVFDGIGKMTQGVGQVVNDIAGEEVLREDNVARTAVIEVGALIGGDNGAKVAAIGYDVTILAANIYAGLLSNIAASNAVCACFVAGTKVLALTGEVEIENVEAGDYVISTNPQTGETTIKRVVQTFVNETDELIHIDICGEKIVCTKEHPFYMPTKGWTAACELRAGDILVTVNGEYVVVEQVQHELLESPVKVYNFEVEDFHTYYVGESSVLVHNMCAEEFIRSPKNAKQVIKYLKKAGFVEVSRKGSHIKLYNGSYTAIVPYHGSKEIPTGTLKSIFKQAGLIE